MKFVLALFLVLSSHSSFSQKLLGALMADDNGVTQNPKKAKYLVVMQGYGDTGYVRLDYKFAGSMITRVTFLDSALQVPNGKYSGYNSAGYLVEDGNYFKGKKEGVWYVYNDTSHAIIKNNYHLDTLLSVINLDSLDKEKEKTPHDTTGEIEAVYKGGDGKIMKIIQSKIVVPDRMASLTKGGTTSVRFVVDTNGKPRDIEILKSTEFSFDEEAKRVISLLTDWIPASDKGKKVNAYRIQPITVVLE